ncbi:threonine aldolase family protein [Spirillospora sp. CA-255316]
MTLLHEPDLRQFGSDNQAGAHPLVLAALAEANRGHVLGYGNDPYTRELAALTTELFGDDTRMYPVFGGTGANVVALAAMAGRWQGVLCAASAHIATDEGGAPEQLTGVKLVTAPSDDGKLTPESIVTALAALRSVHQVEPAVVSITQATEFGTVYTPDELRAIAELVHTRGLLLHMDGARLVNAAASLGVSLRALTTDVCVDVLSLGGTKNGLLFGDAVVVVNPLVAPRIERVHKGLAQLGSKQRFLSAQLLTLFGTDLWHDLAGTANERAATLAKRLGEIDGVELAHPVESNSVFLHGPAPVEATLIREFACQTFMTPIPTLRIMCSWDTTSFDLDRLLAALRT